MLCWIWIEHIQLRNPVLDMQIMRVSSNDMSCYRSCTIGNKSALPGRSRSWTVVGTDHADHLSEVIRQRPTYVPVAHAIVYHRAVRFQQFLQGGCWLVKQGASENARATTQTPYHLPLVRPFHDDCGMHWPCPQRGNRTRKKTPQVFSLGLFTYKTASSTVGPFGVGL